MVGKKYWYVMYYITYQYRYINSYYLIYFQLPCAHKSSVWWVGIGYRGVVGDFTA